MICVLISYMASVTCPYCGSFCISDSFWCNLRYLIVITVPGALSFKLVLKIWRGGGGGEP